jgi:hypothetical protein
MSALKEQVDGNHYTEMEIQPIELAYKVSGTPGFCKVVKYLTRDKGSKRKNLEKALHCVKLDEELRTVVAPYFLSKEVKGYAYQMPTKSIEAVYICPYTKREIPPILKKFCKQFEECDLYYKILECVYIGDYTEAKIQLEKLINGTK